MLTLQQAEAEAAAGNLAASQDLAIQANSESPELVPAAVMAAKALTERGKASTAAKVVRRAWKAQPHPELARAYAAIAPDEAPAARLKRFDALLSQTPGPEAQMTLAELLIAAEDFPAAHRAMGDLHETDATQRVMTIMAAIERGEGSPDQVVRGWLARALIAPKGPQWVCENCHHVHAGWHAVCANCGAFDTLAWTAPPDSSGPSATGTEMLPLIVGALPAADLPPSPAPEPQAKAPEPEPEAETDDEKDEAEVIDLAETRRMGL